MSQHEATCTCGRLRLVCDGEPVWTSVCHCFACQKRTGSAFGVQARFAQENVRIEGDASEYQRIGDGGSTITFRFCPRCGDTQCWEIEGCEGWLIVPVGAFADPGFPAPTSSVYDARQASWVELSGLLEPMD
jgi:hypothetical protein